MQLVLVHDYLIQMGGAERVVAAMHRRFPKAPIYTSAINRDTLWDDFTGAEIRTTWLQHAPLIEDHTHFKKYFPLYSSAFRSFGRIEADCAWVSSSTFAKYTRFSPGTRTVCYIHNPTRFLWQADDYIDYEVKNGALNKLVRATLPLLRGVDKAAAQRMDVLVANSRNVQERIRRCYGRDSLLIHPPVQTSRLKVSTDHDGFYLIVSRLLGYKNVDLAVRAFSRCGRRLVVVGDGPRMLELEEMAGPTVELLGHRSDREIQTFFARCRAVLLPGQEDFGITPVEAMACGKPVIALGRGGALETVLDGETGLFFAEPREEALLDAVERLEANTWDPWFIRKHAEHFSEENFLERMTAVLENRAARVP